MTNRCPSSHQVTKPCRPLLKKMQGERERTIFTWNPGFRVGEWRWRSETQAERQPFCSKTRLMICSPMKSCSRPILIIIPLQTTGKSFDRQTWRIMWYQVENAAGGHLVCKKTESSARTHGYTPLGDRPRIRKGFMHIFSEAAFRNSRLLTS